MATHEDSERRYWRMWQRPDGTWSASALGLRNDGFATAEDAQWWAQNRVRSWRRYDGGLYDPDHFRRRLEALTAAVMLEEPEIRERILAKAAEIEAERD